MGMYDSLYGADGNEWQTKAFACELTRYSIGDPCPVDPYELEYDLTTFQVEVLGRSGNSFATVRDCVLASVDDERDPTLPLIDYFGARVENGALT